MSKKLTKKELFDILNSLDECPPKNDLINILYHTLLEDTSICTETHFAFYRTVSKEIIEYSNKYFILISGDHTLEDIIDFIYSFLENFKTLKKELYKKHKKELLRTNYKCHY
ncbi:Plasmodium exported protein (PHISTa-like), putative [Plasmodium sp. DRC-Itaito]|nr:Plasmodium exported protein (PHISTa-like), putative [Plasmodium sp. DRC-Itaito]